MKRLPLILLLALVSCRDFHLGTTYLTVEVSPAIARKDSVVTVSVSGTALGAAEPEVRLMGQLLPRTSGSPSTAPTFTYTVTGAEPEGVDLAVDVSAGAVAHSAKVRFDFTPPNVAAITAHPPSATLGMTVEVELVASEPLSSPPELTDRGRTVPCAADPIDLRLFHCTLTATSVDQAGWQSASVKLVDSAGNEGILSTLPLGVVFDFGQSLAVVDPNVQPPVASDGATVHIAFATTLRLTSTPTVRLGQLDAQLVEPAGDDGVWHFEYRVTGEELGLEPREQTLDVDAFINGNRFALGAVVLDFLPPQPTSVTANRKHVGTPAHQTNDVAVTLVCNEPISTLQASVQNRAMTCEPPKDAPATTWTCKYSADGTELEGPQKLVVWLSDTVGNSQRLTTTDDAFSFDFSAKLDPSKLFVVGRFGESWRFAADPGAAEPESTLSVRRVGQASETLSAVVLPDGSVDEVGELGETLPEVEVQQTDLALNVSGWVRARTRFVADPTHAPESKAATWKWRGGTDVPELLEFTSVSPPQGPVEAATPAEVAALAKVDGTPLRVSASQVAPPTWSIVPNQGYVPLFYVRQPLAYIPGVGVLHTDLDDQPDYGNAFVWDGEGWRVLPPNDYDGAPRFNSDQAYALTVDPLTQRFVVAGNGQSRNGDDSFTWQGQFSMPLTTSSTPELEYLALHRGVPPKARYYHAMAYDRDARASVLFGGGFADESSDPEYFSDTRLFNEANGWSLASPISVPPVRTAAAMAHDRSRHRTAMFGGWSPEQGKGSCDSEGCTLDDTWEWTGLDWIQRRVSGPPARLDHAMAYHAVERAVMVTGGWCYTDRDQELWTLFDDQWALDAKGWTQWALAAPPVYQAGLAYDERRGRLVLFGGLLESVEPSYDVWEMSETGLVPGVFSRLEMNDAGRLPSQLTLRVTARASSPRGDSEALTVHAWDFIGQQWATLATAPASAAPVELTSTVQGADVARFLPGQTLFVLVTALPSSVAGEAVLEVDALQANADW
ncbi:MAG: hypothetical protein QM765_35175 [Myxococcales bacterium]